jgi:hypothetical protein
MQKVSVVLLLMSMSIPFASSAVAQTNDLLHEHSLPIASNVIDGALHPEFIPDSVAYRLFLLTVSETLSPSEDRVKRQRAFLIGAGLDDNDIRAAIPILSDFKRQNDGLIKEYNESVVKANLNHTSPDLAGFILQRDRLVQSTRDALTGSISHDAMTRLHAHIQDEKRNMKISKGVQ